jgi:hypothetical protein
LVPLGFPRSHVTPKRTRFRDDTTSRVPSLSPRLTSSLLLGTSLAVRAAPGASLGRAAPRRPSMDACKG